MWEWESIWSSLISAVALKSFSPCCGRVSFNCILPLLSTAIRDYPYQAFIADAIKTHQTANTLASLLHVSEQFSERSCIFYSHKPPTPPPLHTLMHTFSHARKCQARSTSSKRCLAPEHES